MAVTPNRISNLDATRCEFKHRKVSWRQALPRHYSASLYIRSFSCTCAHPLLFSCCCMLWKEKSAAQLPCIYSRFRARVVLRCYFHVAACYGWQQVWLSLLVYTIVFVHVCSSVVIFMLLHAMNGEKCRSASFYIQSFPCTCADPLLFSCCGMQWITTSVAQPPCIYNHFRARVPIRCYVHVVVCYEWKRVWLSILVCAVVSVRVWSSVVILLMSSGLHLGLNHRSYSAQRDALDYHVSSCVDLFRCSRTLIECQWTC